MQKVVFGLVGGKGAGKDTVAALLPAVLGEAVLRLSFSQFLVEDVCVPLGIEPTHENLQLLGNMARPEWFHERARKRIQEAEERYIVIPSIRRQGDVDFLKTCEPSRLLAIETDPCLSFERMKARREKPGEESLTWEQFTALRQAPVESEVEGIMAQADYRLMNDGSKEDLHQQLVELGLCFTS